MKQPYLDRVESFIKSKSAKKQILSELESHISDKTAYYTEIGYSHEEAEQRAVEDMGDPEQAAISLNAMHSVKWYKVPLNIISLAFMLIVIIFSSQSYYFDYGNELNDINHSIIKDAASFVFFAGISLILYFSYKRRNKFSALTVTVMSAVMLILPVTVNLLSQTGLFLNLDENNFYVLENLLSFKYAQALFEPFWFAIISLFSKGPVGYINTVLTPASHTYETRLVFQLFAAITQYFFAAWGLIIFIMVRRSEACKSAKGLSRAGKVFAIISTIICLITALLMLTGSLFAEKNADSVTGESRKMIDFVLLYKDSDTEADILSRAESYGIELENTTGSYDDDFEYKFYTYYSGNCGITYMTDDSEGNMLSYYVNTASSPGVVEKEKIEVNKNAFDSLSVNKTTLEEFKQDGDFYKAAALNANSNGSFQFQYIIKNSDDRFVLDFENNKLISKTITDFNGYEADYEEETTLPVPSSTVFNLLN